MPFTPLVTVNFSPAFTGSGADGAVVLDGVTSYPFASLAANVYTLTRSVQASTLAINAGVTLKPNGWAIFCIAPIQVAATAVISNNGNSALGQAAGTASAGGALYASTRAGGAGGTGVSGAGAAGGNSAQGGSGGNGGAGTSGAAGPGGAATQTTANALQALVTPYPVLVALISLNNNGLPLGWGSGGGGGGSDASSNAGGGGGAAGGVVAIFAGGLVNAGSITAAGGNGAAGAAGNAGGGGGGAGGLVAIYTQQPVVTVGAGSITAAGGSPGAGVGTGAAGIAGGAGSVVTNVI